MNPLCVIGLDLGTTSAKAVLFNQQQQVLATFSKAVETIHGDDGAAEQRPDDIAAAALEVLIQAAREANQGGYEVSLVGFSSAMHSLIALDEANKPLTNALIWMDARPNEDAMALRKQPRGQSIYAATGTPIHAMTPLAKLLWLRRNRLDLFNKAARFVSLKEYIWAEWFREWVIDESMAGATGLYCMKTRDWDSEALECTGVQPRQLSRIVPTTYIKKGPAHDALRQAGFAFATFNIGASDGVLANLGVGAVDSASMVLTVGTSCAVRLTTADPLTDFTHQPFSYVLNQDHYVVGGPSNSGGVIVDWIANSVLGPANSLNPSGASELSVLIEEASTLEPDDLVCLPYAAGERAPLWNADWTGAFIGLRLTHGRVHLFRAALEGIFLNAYWIAESLLKAGHQPTQLVASGKLLENPFVRQLCADIFNLPVVGGDVGDASARGAAMLARIATGEIQYADVSPSTDVHRTLPSERLHQVYMRKYKIFCALCNAIDPIVTGASSAEL